MCKEKVAGEERGPIHSGHIELETMLKHPD